MYREEYIVRIIHKDTNKLVEENTFSDEETQEILTLIGQINARHSSVRRRVNGVVA